MQLQKLEIRDSAGCYYAVLPIIGVRIMRTASDLYVCLSVRPFVLCLHLKNEYH